MECKISRFIQKNRGFLSKQKRHRILVILEKIRPFFHAIWRLRSVYGKNCSVYQIKYGVFE